MEDLKARGVILRAFDQFRVKSCIDFKPRDSEVYYLNIQKLDGYVYYFLFASYLFLVSNKYIPNATYPKLKNETSTRKLNYS